jgi:hypothetical protein
MIRLTRLQYFLQIAGVDDPLAYSILVAAVGLIGVLISLFVVRRIGRRSLMLAGTLSCGLCQLVPAVAWSVSTGSKSTARLVVAFICLFEPCFVAYCELLTSSIPSDKDWDR